MRASKITHVPAQTTKVTVPVPAVGELTPQLSLLVVSETGHALHELPRRGEVSIGRGRSCTIQLDHPTVSRRHVILRLDEDVVTLEDLGSSNGTKARGEQLPSKSSATLEIGEAFEIGSVTLVVQRRFVETAQPVPARGDDGPVVQSEAMQSLYELARRVAGGDVTVLIEGETGVGKEVLAEVIHRASPRAGRPFLRLNCAALSETLVESELFGHERGAFTGASADKPGLLETANGGTVLLDEIGELSMPMQAKLLRVLENRELRRVGSTRARTIDVRFVAATNRDLAAEAERGTFRRDLFYRLGGVILTIPPLRERKDELPALASALIADAAAAQRLAQPPVLADDALEAMRAHAWPGNIRELRNVIERAVLLAGAGPIRREDLRLDKPARPSSAPLPMTDRGEAHAQDDERRRIVEALDKTAGNQTAAAKLLGISRRTLVYKLALHRIPRPRARG